MDDLEVTATALHALTILFNVLSTVYLPVIQGSIEMSVEENDIILNDEINPLLQSCTMLIQCFYKLIVLAATCAQGNIPNPRIERVLFPDFLRSEFRGRDLFNELQHCQHLFWSLTGESVESFLQIIRDISPVVTMQTRRGNRRQNEYPYLLNIRNRILLVMIWLRMYPEYSLLSSIFMVSPTTVHKEIRTVLPTLWRYFREMVRWPTPQQWLQMANNWYLFPGAVAVIDGTRHEIQIPQTEPQQHFYSGHCHYHNFSTQIIMDNRGNIVFIQSGFLGHNNDSGQFQLMPRIGPAEELHLPHGLYILADKGYPLQYPLVTPWRRADAAGNPQRELFNLELRRVRVGIEHCIRRVKEYGVVQHIWRHERWMFPIVLELCACLAQRHISLSTVL